MKNKSNVTKPNLFIVGKAKSGTTGLYWMLRQHPEVFMSPDKETNYFSFDLYGKNNKKRKYKTKKEYLELFSDVKKEKYWGEASPLYIESKTAAKEIKKFNPNAKIIIMLREPIDFIMSWYQHKNFKKPEKEKPSFEEFINEKDSKERLKYSEQIKRYLKEFPKRNIHIIIYEDFKKDNLKEYKKICRFLEVDESFKPVLKEANPRRVPRKNIISKTLLNIPTRKIYRFLDNILPVKTKNKVFKIGFNIIFKKQKWEVNPVLKKQLKKQLKPEVEKVDNLLRKEGFLSKDRNLVHEWSYDNLTGV